MARERFAQIAQIKNERLELHVFLRSVLSLK